MKELLYWIVEWIAKIHSHILRLNDAYEYNFTDRKSTRLNSSHNRESRMPSSA